MDYSNCVKLNTFPGGDRNEDNCEEDCGAYSTSSPKDLAVYQSDFDKKVPFDVSWRNLLENKWDHKSLWNKAHEGSTLRKGYLLKRRLIIIVLRRLCSLITSRIGAVWLFVKWSFRYLLCLRRTIISTQIIKIALSEIAPGICMLLWEAKILVVQNF